MSHATYPPFSGHVVTDVIGIIRGGNVSSQLPLLAKCIWEIIGMGLSVTLGEPEPHEHAFGALAEASVEDLEECKAALESVEPTYGAEGENAAIDPATLAMLIQLAVQIITALLNRKKAGS